MNAVYSVIALLFTGVFAVKFVIPLAGFFGAVITVTGVGAIWGMYLYAFASLLVAAGLYASLWVAYLLCLLMIAGKSK